ncbi:N-acetylmuramoyl-L-alanine amidase [Atopobiaceae bacterium 24-176]
MPKLYVIPGHGNGDPGAGGGGYTEADLVRKLAQRIKDLAANPADVTLHDFSRNAYAQGDLNTLNVPKGTMVLELHMDAAGGNARGAHVIIKDGFKADSFDTALADALAKIFPGRSSIIVGRSDLANVNRAARRGINFRLAECGFIDNATDRQTFIDRMDDVARAILSAAGIAAKNGAVPTTPVVTAPAPAQRVGVDGVWGPKTTTVAQQSLGLVDDGEVWGQYTGNLQYLPNVAGGWKFLSNPNGSPLIRKLQSIWGVDTDGIMGKKSVEAMQRRYGVGVDGIMGPKTVTAFQKALNGGKL